MNEYQLQALNETLLQLSKASQDIIKLVQVARQVNEMIAAHNLAAADAANLLGMTLAEWNTVSTVLDGLITDYDVAANQEAILKTASHYRDLTQLVRG